MKPINMAPKLIVSKTVFVLFHGEKYILAKRFINSNHVLTPPQIKLSNFLKYIYNMCIFTIQKQKRKTEPNICLPASMHLQSTNTKLIPSSDDPL